MSSLAFVAPAASPDAGSLPPAPEPPEAVLIAYVRAHSDASGFPIEDPTTRRRWAGEVMLDRMIIEPIRGRACPTFRARRVGAEDPTVELVEVSLRLDRGPTGWIVSDPIFSRVRPD